jgi:hypothetical protein
VFHPFNETGSIPAPLDQFPIGTDSAPSQGIPFFSIGVFLDQENGLQRCQDGTVTTQREK